MKTKFAFVLLAISFLASCRPTEDSVTVVGRFDDSTLIFRQRIDTFIDADMQVALITLTRGNLACALTLFPQALARPEPAVPYKLVGSGELSCSYGPILNVEWHQTSDHSGFGYSTNENDPGFMFGFSKYPFFALNQLDEAEKALFAYRNREIQ